MSSAESLGSQLPLWSAVPFVVLLGAIAGFEIFFPNWWGSLRNKAVVALAVATPAAVPLLALGSDGRHALAHSLTDYVSFIALLTALFVVAGGIEVRGSLAGTPLANTAMLGIGALSANLVGTTGAAMVLIRPFLRANNERGRRAHLIIFFILIVANSGGLLTPLGDPPLYLGFLRGVPFTWTLNLWLPWLIVNGLLLLIFAVVDHLMLARDQRERQDEPMQGLTKHEPVRVHGLRNVVILGAIVAVILASGTGLGNGGQPWPTWLQGLLLAGLALLSYLLTPGRIHAANQFSLHPMAAVAVLFFGIFVAMTTPLVLLNAHADELGLVHSWQFFWTAGGLSAVLDNAPTYLSFASVAAGQEGIATDGAYLHNLIATDRGASLVSAISVGAVCMGSLTYIGNGPNLMVREIAVHRGIRMPSFFAYAFAATAILGPILVLITLIFYV